MHYPAATPPFNCPKMETTQARLQQEGEEMPVSWLRSHMVKTSPCLRLPISGGPAGAAPPTTSTRVYLIHPVPGWLVSPSTPSAPFKPPRLPSSQTLLHVS